MNDALPQLPVILATFLLAGFVKGVTGLGLPTVTVGLLGTLMPPAAAATFVVVPALVANTWQMPPPRALVPLLRRPWPMVLGLHLAARGFW